MPTKFLHPRFAWLAALGLLSAPAFADDDRRFDAGVRLLLTSASSVPISDIPGYGVYGRYRLNDQWSVGLSFDITDFDYEDPAGLLGIPLDPNMKPMDAEAESEIISVFVERSFSEPQARREWFLGSALGMAFTDVADVSGTSATGDPFDIHTEADRELILSLQGGVRQRFGQNWYADFTLRADQHFAAWEPTDRVSGAEARSEDYLAFGFHLGVGYRF